MTMTEIKYLLDQALPAQPGPVDPAADLTRGRARLHRTRRSRVAALGCAAVIAIGLPLAVTLTGPDAATAPSRAPVLTSIELVAYTGEQVPGYEVSEVPAGWEIQGGNAFALVLAPQGFPDQSTDSFAGKITVMLASKDEGGLATDGTKVTVNGRPGLWHTEGDTQLLRFEGADGRIVDVQVPISLRWDGEHLARFGAGIKVLGHADQGLG